MCLYSRHIYAGRLSHWVDKVIMLVSVITTSLIHSRHHCDACHIMAVYVGHFGHISLCGCFDCLYWFVWRSTWSSTAHIFISLCLLSTRQAGICNHYQALQASRIPAFIGINKAYVSDGIQHMKVKYITYSIKYNMAI